ncbi:MAG: diguanylate cyclase [Lachnospiraceae bacterium]|nr:diguanylate cyclase [Lachnospiraceae bacterium]
MKKNPLKWLTIVLLSAVAILSTISYLFYGVDREENKAQNILIGEMVNAYVMEDLSEAITVSRMMSRDETLIELLKVESVYPQDSMVMKMRNYLNSIQKKFGFSSVYTISDQTQKYYSFVGLNKVIDPEKNSTDIWYTIFMESGNDYKLDSSADEVNRDKLTIFVDNRVEDESGSFLGVVGVGVETEELQKKLSKYEEDFSVRIDYVTSDGLVQMSSRTFAAHSSYVSGVKLPEKNNTAFEYQTYGIDGFAVVKYVPEFDWYMVIRSESTYSAIGYNYKFFFAEFVILMLAISVFAVVYKSVKTESVPSKAINRNVDELTGVLNRDYFIRVYGSKGTLNTTQYQSVCEFTIDDFELIENTPACDRIILSVVKTARESFGRNSQITRWGKSAFVVLLGAPIDEAEDECKSFCKQIEEIGEVTVSVGLTSIELNETLKTNYFRAARYMYLVRELGGNNVKRG